MFKEEQEKCNHVWQTLDDGSQICFECDKRRDGPTGVGVVKPSIDFKTQTIHLETTFKVEGFAESVCREWLATKDKAIRAALIKLGWTPPGEEPCQTADCPICHPTKGTNHE